jgi:hypothetical protein
MATVLSFEGLRRECPSCSRRIVTNLLDKTFRPHGQGMRCPGSHMTIAAATAAARGET